MDHMNNASGTRGADRSLPVGGGGSEPSEAADCLPVRLPFIQFTGEIFRAIDWRWVMLPPVLLACEFVAVYSLRGFGRHLIGPFETVALIVLWAAVGAAFLRLVVQRRVFFGWLTVFAAALMFREYHLMKSSTTILYLTVGLLGFVAWYAYPVLSPYLRGRRVMTLLAMVGMCYLLTQTLDFDVFKEGHVIFSVTEEIMEVTGHCFVLLLSLTAKPAA